MNILLLLLALNQDAFTRLGEGVVDEKGSTLTVAGAAGKIQALDAASGRVKWSSDSVGRVIATAGGKVAVEAAAGNAVKILLLDAEAGTLLSTSPALTLPEWVSTSPANGRSFAARASMDRSTLVYDWEATASYAGGAPPPPEIEKAARKNAAGRVSIDLAKNTLTSGPLPSEALQALRSTAATVKIGKRTYTVVEGTDKVEPGAGMRRARRLTCVSTDPAEPGWSHPLRPVQVPIPFPSAPPARP